MAVTRQVGLCAHRVADRPLVEVAAVHADKRYDHTIYTQKTPLNSGVFCVCPLSFRLFRLTPTYIATAAGGSIGFTKIR